MKETFRKINDYTLSHDVQMDKYANGYVEGKFELKRIFNFASGQITTIARDWLSQSRGSESGGSSGTSLQMQVQDFTDLPSTVELEMMHKRLKELEGKPPELETILVQKGKPRMLGGNP